jgi:TPP-dependent pyruvate/acetoin dehydrogenase alpha subunit
MTDLAIEENRMDSDSQATEHGGARVLASLDLGGLPRDQLTEWLDAMLLIREFEEAADQLTLRGKVPGGIHVAVGQEAVAVGAVRALGSTDITASGHRSHHHALAKGLPAPQVMAELYGKATGVVGGRGGTMHLADFERGYFGGNGIVGAGLGIAMGAALGAQQRDSGQVAVGFVGDGGANTGRTWEFVNLAAIWKLPLIVVCENNLYAVETHTDRVTAGGSIAGRASGFGLPTEQIDGQDIGAVYRAVGAARERALAGDGPTFIEARTYRYHGHNTGDVIRYRAQDEVDEWRSTKDPILRFAAALEQDGVLEPGQLEGSIETAKRRTQEAVDFAEESEYPAIESALEGVSDWNHQVRGNA